LFNFEAFREVLEGRSAAHPFENVQSLLPPNSWLGLYPVPGELYLSFCFISVSFQIFFCCSSLSGFDDSFAFILVRAH